MKTWGQHFQVWLNVTWTKITENHWSLRDWFCCVFFCPFTVILLISECTFIILAYIAQKLRRPLVILPLKQHDHAKPTNNNWLNNRLLVAQYLLFSPSVVPLKKKKPGKNPDVDTSFLPDREREVLYDQRIYKRLHLQFFSLT